METPIICSQQRHQKQYSSIRKSTDTIFWDHKGVLLVDSLDCGDTAASQLYCGTLLLHQDIILTATSGPIQPTGILTGYDAMAGRLWTTLPTVLISCPLICFQCQYEASYHLVTHAWQRFFLCWDTNFGTTVGQMLKLSIVTTWKSDVYHLLWTCHIYNQMRIKFLAYIC